jgi:hypothetical protein
VLSQLVDHQTLLRFLWWTPLLSLSQTDKSLAISPSRESATLRHIASIPSWIAT